MTETLTLTVDGSPMRALFNLPDGPGPFPAVVAMHPHHGIDTPFMEFCMARAALAGFAIVAPDTYHHYQGTDPHDFDGLRASQVDQQMINDMAACAQLLKARRDIIPDAIFLMGFCMGGRLTYLGASAVRDFRAAAPMYGGGMFSARGSDPSVFDRIKTIRCPIAGFYGLEDSYIPQADIDRIDAELTKYGIPHVFHCYPHAGHGFADPNKTDPKVQAAGQDAWIKAFDFFRSQMAVQAAVAE